MRKVFSLLLALLTVCSLAVPAFAAGGSTITIKNTKLFSFDVDSEYHETDLFDNFKDVMPGDNPKTNPNMVETITIRNRAWSHDYVKVYLKAVAHDEKKNPLEYSETFENEDGKDQANIAGQRDETVATMSDFLSQLTMRVYDGNKLIYKASPDELDGLKNSVYLGTLRRNKSMDLRVELDVPIELGNEYANRVGEVDWVFTVEAYNDPSDNPKTGDYIIMAAIALLIASGAALLILFFLKKKRKK